MANLFRGASTTETPADDKTSNKNRPVGQIPLRGWLTAPATRRVIDALTARGTEMRFVGGCLRDTLLGRETEDIDIATPEPPEAVMALLEEAGIKALPTGIAHGTVTAIVEGQRFEITTLRRDVETFGRRAHVAFTDDWLEDAKRRDFTFNALSATPDGQIFDPFNGIADLASGWVRFIGRAEQRIDEDALRILRFFRFFAWLGHPPVDADALQACRLKAEALKTLSGERIWGEMKKLLRAPEPAATLVLMQGEHILAPILPEAENFGALRQLTFLETRGLVRDSIAADPLRRLAILIEGGREAARAVAKRFRLSKRQADRLAVLADPPCSIGPDLDLRQARRLLHQLGADRFRDLLLMSWARRRAAGTRREMTRESGVWHGLLDHADVWTPRTLPIGGRDLILLGHEPGPSLGGLLAALESWWIDEDFQPDRDRILEKARDLTRTP